MTLTLANVSNGMMSTMNGIGGNIREGAEILLNCAIAANPNVSFIKWTHNGLDINSDDSRGKCVFTLFAHHFFTTFFIEALFMILRTY